MRYIFSMITIIGILGITTTHAQNVFNNIFRPSIERGYIIDVGDSKDSVGSAIFEGGIDANINIQTQKACQIHNVVIQASEGECSNQGGTWTAHTYTQNSTNVTSYRCVKNDPITIQTSESSCNEGGVWSFGICKIAGRTVHTNNQSQCESTKGSWNTVENIFEVNQREPLFVRIAKLLLRITIALSVTFILYNAVVYILSFGDSGKASSAQKKLLNIIIGVIIALSSIGIIYLLQSIVTQTIRY